MSAAARSGASARYPGTPSGPLEPARGPVVLLMGPTAVGKTDVAVELPNDEEYTWLDDLDGDGRQDLVLHHPFTERDPHGTPRHPPGTEPHRIVVLLSRG